jgi:para-nitrobenzyl esterase
MTICFAGAAHAAAPAEARISNGRLAGELMPDGVRVFRGIPYAAPPTGDLRWRDPQAPASWSGVRDATTFGPRCMQAAGSAGGRVREDVASLPISEDCLYLNVWTTATHAGQRRPVIIWTHGGSFTIGTGSQYVGAELARRGVVLVTHNYRLGAFGFLAHPLLSAESPHRSSGNYGFADTQAVLAWVHENIEAFGGDPRNVTLMGQSAGGRLIQDLRVSPCARGLFHRAIIQSAPVRILPMTLLADAERDGSEAAAKLHATSLRELRGLSAQQVFENFPVGQPIVDGHCIPGDPLRAADAGRSHRIDLLVGSNADEGTFPFLRARDFRIGFASEAEFLDYTRRRFGEGADEFLQVYSPAGNTDYNASQREAFRDEVAWLALFTAQRHAELHKGRVYLYYFGHRPPALPDGTDRGATHGAEIPYAFNTPGRAWTDADRRIADTMTSYWVNFATHGDPNGAGLPPWPAFHPKDGQPMKLGPMTPGDVLDAARTSIYDELYRRTMTASAGQRKGE